MAGRREEALAKLADMRKASRIPLFLAWIDYLIAWVDRRPDGMNVQPLAGSILKIQDDPEAIFQEGWMRCDIGDFDKGLAEIRRAVDKGYFVAPTLVKWSQFDPVRGDPRFIQLLADAEAGRQRALEAFREAGGERLLGS
jgi:hypothetical protein